MSDQPIAFTGGIPVTHLDPEPPAIQEALAQALGAPEAERRAALATVAARWPRCLAAWAHLGEHARDDTEAYAYFRVGYHRGLDSLRGSGWRGSGYVPWSHEPNRGFLRALAGLQRTAEAIGEADEAERCALFLQQLDPTWPPADLT
jgi:uncharacterized protein DUF3151